MSEGDFPDYNPFCQHGSGVGECYVCQLEDEITSRNERISELVAENAELKKDSEELAARRWLTDYECRTGNAINVFPRVFPVQGNGDALWQVDGWNTHEPGKGPVDLARKLGWEP